MEDKNLNDQKTVEELEEVISWEKATEDPKSFMYQLHENNFFDTNKLAYLLATCYQLIKLYQHNGTTNNYFRVLKDVTTIFEYTLFLIACHFIEDDQFVIKNYTNDLTPEKIADYYSQFRTIREQLIDLNMEKIRAK